MTNRGSGPHIVTFKVEEEDYLAAAKLNRAPPNRGARKWSAARYYFRVVFWLLLLLLAFVIFKPGSPATQADNGFVTGVIAGVGVTALCLALLGVYARYFGEPRRHKRLYQQYKAMQRRQQLSWSDEGLVLASEQGSTRIDWSELIKWKEGNGLILLYLSDALYLVIPRRCFPDAETHAAFRSALQVHIPTERQPP